MSAYGKLYLVPVPISNEPANKFIPEYNFEVVQQLKNFIAEDAKTARRFLKAFGYPEIEKAEIQLLNEHSQGGDIPSLLAPLLNGEDAGLMSDAGCPGIADPGADLIRLAHKKGIEVVPLSGPSSVVMSIMASGFNGQNFAFVGYLPLEKGLRIKRIRELERLALQQNQAQFFIETPYRNQQLVETLLEILTPGTSLFIGKDITSNSQYLLSKTILDWKKFGVPAMHKIPVVFGIFK
jgi:16S rRNA (cytidine1402-2'-O)-methyltransferase